MATTCQICGRHLTLWVGAPLGPGECAEGGIDMCQTAMNDARASALRRKVCPEAFDASGKIKPDGLPLVLEAMSDAGLSFWTGLPVARPQFRKIADGEPT